MKKAHLYSGRLPVKVGAGVLGQNGVVAEV